MTNDHLKTEVGTSTGMCVDGTCINVRTGLKGTLVSCITFSGIQTRVSIKSDYVYCLQWLLIKHLWQLLNTHPSVQIRQQLVHHTWG
jgi:hypothetical protein